MPFYCTFPNRKLELDWLYHTYTLDHKSMYFPITSKLGGMCLSQVSIDHSLTCINCDAVDVWCHIVPIALYSVALLNTHSDWWMTLHCDVNCVVSPPLDASFTVRQHSPLTPDTGGEHGGASGRHSFQQSHSWASYHSMLVMGGCQGHLTSNSCLHEDV